MFFLTGKKAIKLRMAKEEGIIREVVKLLHFGITVGKKKIVFCKTQIIWGGIIIKKYKRYNLDNELISTLERIKRDLEGPFPSDIEKLEEDYNEFCSAEDFYEFFMLIVGSLSYVLADKKLPKRQLDSLSKSFLNYTQGTLK